MRKVLDLLRVTFLVLVLIGLAGIVSGQNQTVSVAILNFQDDTGANAPAELGQRLAQDLHQKIANSYNDLLPRMSTTADVATIKSLSIEQIAALGKQSSAKFVVRGGLLSFVSEPAGSDTKVTVQLYADIISVDAASLVTSVRAAGSATQFGAAPQLSAIDPRSDQFSTSGVGQAFVAAISQLADSIHQAITGSVSGTTPTTSGTGQSTTQPDTTQTEAAKTAEADAELQQLIAQAQSLISSNANTSSQSVGAVSQALGALQTALQTKASVMEKGQDTSQADQEIANQKQALQTAITQLTNEASATPGTATTESGQVSGQKKGFMDKINDFAGQALTMLQKIQEIRTTLRSFNESSANPTVTQPTSDPSANPAGTTEQSPGEANGQVVDQNGNPIPNAQVTDQNSGATTTTDNSGQYSLKGLVPNQLAKLIVKAGDKTMSAQAQVVGGHATTVDFQLKPNTGIVQANVLPSTVILNSQTTAAGTGNLKGVIRDTQGRPVPRALVTLKGLGVARTNSQGEYQFVNVPAGSRQLVINQSGQQTKTLNVRVTAAKSAEAGIQFAPTDRIVASSLRSSLVVSSGATLRGTVTDNESHPLAGAKVSVIQEQSAVSVFTATDGSFGMRNLKPGSYRVIASKPGYENAVQNVNLASAPNRAIQFQLKQQNSTLVAGLLRRQMNRQSVIRGRVLGPNSNVIANATVALKATSATSPLATTKTNQNGEYLFNVREGQYEVSASHDSFQTASRVIEVKAGSQVQVDFAIKPAVRTPGRPTPIAPVSKPVKTGGVVGQVLDAKTGRPVAGATVSLSEQQRISTSQTGNFAFANLSPGNYQLTIIKTGYLSTQRTVSVPSGETIRLNLSLPPQLLVPVPIRRP